MTGPKQGPRQDQNKAQDRTKTRPKTGPKHGNTIQLNYKLVFEIKILHNILTNAFETMTT
jgi:hypothetical protein